MRRVEESGDEILGRQISADEKMRFIKTVEGLFGKGADTRT
jgi:hypothetical protein